MTIFLCIWKHILFVLETSEIKIHKMIKVMIFTIAITQNSL